MYPYRVLIAIGLAAFLGSLVVFAPLQIVVKMLPATSQLRSAGVEGTLLDARVQATTRAGDVVWNFQLQPWYLLTLGIGGSWQVEGTDIDGHGDAVMRPWGFSANVEAAEVAVGRLGRLLGAEGFETDQPLYLRDVSLQGRPGAGVRAVDGRMAWGPGTVRLRNRAQPVQVPALVGQLGTEGDRIALVVGSEAAPDVPLMTAGLDLQTRELHVVVLGRALRLLGLATRQVDEKPAFELRQPLQ